jgi:hypothetical protein
VDDDRDNSERNIYYIGDQGDDWAFPRPAEKPGKLTRHEAVEQRRT